MLVMDAAILRQLVMKESDSRAVRQSEIIDGIDTPLAPTLANYQINTPLRIAHFLAQIAYESDDFCTTEEYASGNAYQGRADLGNVNPGDGALFKGRGLIQLTGRDNYRAVGKALGLPLEDQPASVNNPFVYLLVSCEFWKENNINPLCDEDNVIAVTQVVNGGQTGIDGRRDYLARAKALVAGLVAGTAVPPSATVPVLYRGMTGDAVTRLQTRLSALGYPVAIDGVFGPATELAVKMFQKYAGLTVDGVAGAETIGRMG